MCLSVVVSAHFSLRTIHLYTLVHAHTQTLMHTQRHRQTHKPRVLALSSNKTTMVQPLVRQPRWTDRFDVCLDTRTNTQKQNRIESCIWSLWWSTLSVSNQGKMFAKSFYKTDKSDQHHCVFCCNYDESHVRLNSQEMVFMNKESVL